MSPMSAANAEMATDPTSPYLTAGYQTGNMCRNRDGKGVHATGAASADVGWKEAGRRPQTVGAQSGGPTSRAPLASGASPCACHVAGGTRRGLAARGYG